MLFIIITLSIWLLLMFCALLNKLTRSLPSSLMIILMTDLFGGKLWLNPCTSTYFDPILLGCMVWTTQGSITWSNFYFINLLNIRWNLIEVKAVSSAIFPVTLIARISFIIIIAIQFFCYASTFTAVFYKSFSRLHNWSFAIVRGTWSNRVSSCTFTSTILISSIFSFPFPLVFFIFRVSSHLFLFDIEILFLLLTLYIIFRLFSRATLILRKHYFFLKLIFNL